ncbi:MAG: polysaccharide biosynthesis tyrosine autokinase [Candidatus Lernaella stagnicola]|nr:polysaccharide biosynthesis tyrosine autokinase [Candidatus Lernaella stagnicola]
MYAEYYGLTKLPFSITPDPEFVFMSSSHHEALAQMLYGIQERKSLMVVTGEVGVGKTTMIYTLLSHIETEAKVAILFDTHVDPTSLYRYVFADFEIEEKGGERAENVLILRKYLEARAAEGQRSILIIDEGHNMSEDIFNELVFLTNLETRHGKLLQIVLVGQPELKLVLNSHKFRQLKQRINLRTEILPLSYKDTRAYMHHRLSQAGAEDPTAVFSDDAVDLIFRYSKGIPRLINTICDNALLIGMARKKKTINPEFVRETYEDLMQLSETEEVEEPAAPIDKEAPAQPAVVESNDPSYPPAAVEARPVETEEVSDMDDHREEVRIVRRIIQLPDGRQVEQKVRKIRRIRRRPRSGKRPDLPAVVDLPDRVGIVRVTHKADKELMPAVMGQDPGAVRQYHVLWNKLSNDPEQASRRVILVTSSVPQEGKTITSINLAATIAQEPGVRVLLIDGDLHAPKVHQVLGIEESKPGLSEILQGDIPFTESFYNYELPHLFVMPAGDVPQDPLTYLISPKMSSVLDQAKGMFHYVIVDSPPIIPIPDTVQLADMVDGVLVAVKARVTPREVVARALDDLYQKPLMGIVLNDIEGRLSMAKGNAYGYGYGYGKYGYGYGKPTVPRSVVSGGGKS